MKFQQMALIGLLGLSTLPAVLAAAPAQACTPAPDNPDGCDGLNGGRRVNPQLWQQYRPKLKRPIGPVCLSCPPLKVKDQFQQVQQPVVQEKNILLNQERFNQERFNNALESPYGR